MDTELEILREKNRRLRSHIVVLKGKLVAYREAHIQNTKDINRLSRAGESICYDCENENEDDQGRGENST